MPVKKLFSASLPLLIVFIIHMILWQGFDIYNILPHFDLLEHFAGGFVSGWTLYNIYKVGAKKWKWKIKPDVLIYFMCIGGAMLFATLWEFYEFGHDTLYPLTPLYQLGLIETMVDYFMALVGAVAWCMVAYIANKPRP